MTVRLRRVLSTAAAACALALACAPVLAQTQPGAGQIINLRDAEIGVFIDQVSAITGYSFVVGPEVQGNVTVVSQFPLTPEEVFETFLATLRVQGYAAVRLGPGEYSIVAQDAAARSAGAPSAAPGDSFSTVILRLDAVNAESAAQSITPILSPQGTVTPNLQSNSVIVVDYVSNLERVRQIVAELDRDDSEIVSVPVINMSAREMADIIRDLNEGPTGPQGSLSAVPVRAGNSVVLRGEATAVARMAELVRELDRTSQRQDTIRVIRLQNADAEELVPVLQNLAGTLTTIPSQGGESATTVSSTQPGAPVITLDPSTNSLVLSAPPETLNEMERVIAELDVRRPQVLVEGIIVEVSDTLSRQLGLQFLFGGEPGSGIPFAATSYPGSAPNLLALAGALIDDERVGGGEDGILGDAAAASLLNANGAFLGAGGQTDDGAIFGVILNAVQGDRDSNVLSTPHITTLDNQEAYINVGQEIPISTGEVLSESNDNPFRTIDRKPVGVSLTVTPQIGEGDTIRLQIAQEVSTVIGPVSAASDELITSLREIETTVLADNGEVIVLGGLIQEDDQIQQDKTPLLGDIPVLGAAFRNSDTSRTRTNLMVFIRPTIMRDADTARAETATRFEYMRGQQAAAQAAHGQDGEISLDRVFRDAMGNAAQPVAPPSIAPQAPVPQSAPAEAAPESAIR
jgi:general secretion pathway protein D